MSTPTEWLNEFQVNTGTAATGSESDPQIIGLSNGNILVAWTESGDAIGASNGQDIIGKIYDAEGNVVVDAFQLNDSFFVDDERDFDIAPTNDGGFVMVYVDDGTNDSIRWERYDATGTQIDFATIASGAAGDDLTNPQIAVNLTDNTAIVTFTETLSGSSDQNIIGQGINANGTLTGTEFNAAQNSTDDDTDADIGILANGNYVTVYEEDDFGTQGIEFKIFTSTGTQISNVNVTSGVETSDPQVATLTNGDFVVTWRENSDIKYRVYSETGSAVTSVLTAAGTADNENEPEIVALPDGGFVIVWDNDTDDTLEAQRFNANGTTDGSVFTVENVGTTSPNIGVTGDGRILFTWDAQGGEIFASIWDPRTSPIDASDYDINRTNFVQSTVITALTTSTTINGDGSSEIILGQNGDDIINDGGGDDIVNAGGGNDTVNEGGGNDIYNLESGNDTLVINFTTLGDDSFDGGTGTDLVDFSNITFGSGVTIDLIGEVVTNGTSSDSLVSFENVEGSQGGETIIGDSGSNILNGNGGDDIIEAGFGIDTVNGGAGDDTLEGGFSTDTVNGGTGNDTIIVNNGEFIDNVDGGSGIDTLDLSDIVNANEAADIDLTAGTWTGFGGTTTISSIETIIATQADDIVRESASGGTNSFFLEAGDDILEIHNGGIGGDIFDGGAGVDLIDFSNLTDFFLSPVVIDLTAGTISSGLSSETLINFENVSGSQGNDTIIGDAGANVLTGNEGDDIISGGLGNDILNGTNFDAQGTGEIDILTSDSALSDNDLFVLAERENGIGHAFYNDLCNADYAVIENFDVYNFVGDIADQIQLLGSASQHSITDVTIGGVSGAGISYLGDLVGIVEGISASSLDLQDANQFVYV